MDIWLKVIAYVKRFYRIANAFNDRAVSILSRIYLGGGRRSNGHNTAGLGEYNGASRRVSGENSAHGNLCGNGECLSLPMSK